MSFAAYLRALDRAERAVRSLLGKPRRTIKRRPAQKLELEPVRIASVLPAPRVLPEWLRASVAEGLITEAEAWSMTAPDLALRGDA